MNKVLMTVALVCAALCVAPGGVALAQAAAGGRTAEELKKAETDLSGALMRRDKLLVGHLLAEEWVFADAGGVARGRREFADAISTGALKFDFVSIEEMEARVYGETGVVTGRLVAEWEEGGGENFAKCRFTDVLVWREGRWQFVARQLTRLSRA